MFETSADMTIRRLGPDDQVALVRLAQRDSAPVPTGSMLAAVAPGGALLAAISIESRKVVADPFLPSEHAVGLLLMRARQADGEAGDGGSHRGGRWHLGRRRSHAALAGSPPGAGGRLLALTGLRPPS